MPDQKFQVFGNKFYPYYSGEFPLKPDMFPRCRSEKIFMTGQWTSKHKELGGGDMKLIKQEKQEI